MRYMLLIYSRETEMAERLPDEWSRSGRRIGRSSTKPGDEAYSRRPSRCSRPRPRPRSACEGGKPMILDGPFAETKEQLAGYYILDCRDLDEAIDWAAKSRPHAKAAKAASRSARSRDAAARRRATGTMPQPAEIRASAEAVFRREHGRIIAGLIRLLRLVRPRRGGDAGGLCRGARRMGRARHPAEPGGVDHDRRLAQADRRGAARAHPARKAG